MFATQLSLLDEDKNVLRLLESQLALHSAVELSDYQTVSQLLKAGYPVNQLNEKDLPAIVDSVRRGQVAITSLLVQFDADVTGVLDEHGSTLEQLAVSRGHKETATLLRNVRSIFQKEV
ncbi:hypothetical protein RCL1_000469 [Eukaryota sp. TZLM3-RCL]